MSEQIDQIETQADNFEQVELAVNNDSDTDKQVEYDEEDLDERDNNENESKQITKQKLKITQLEQKLKNADEISDEEDEYQEEDEHDEHEDEEEWDKSQWKRNYGNHIPFLFMNGQPLVTIGPNWFVNLFMILFLSGSDIFVIKYLQLTQTQFNITLVLSIILNISYLLTSLANPGIKSSKFPIHELDVKFACETCEIVEEQDLNTFHCLECDVCIEEADFHFIWIGKCVGKGNKSYFVCFALSFLVYIFFILFIFIKSSK